MRPLRLLRWSGTVLSPRTRPPCLVVVASPYRSFSVTPYTAAQAATASAVAPNDNVSQQEDFEDDVEPSSNSSSGLPRSPYAALPSPPAQAAASSTRLHALHARLRLSRRFPVTTLARCLIDPTADPNPAFNNSSLAVLGNDLLGYYASELILCRYPRIPLAVLFAAMKAYAGPAALSILSREWGVETAAFPGGEVDPGLLQYVPMVPGNADLLGDGIMEKQRHKRTEKLHKPWQRPRAITRYTTDEDYFGNAADHDVSKPGQAVTLTTASMGFVRALIGAVHLHNGRTAAKAFFNDHIGSRKLDAGKLFSFRQPTRDLGRLCAREDLQSPVARLISETGRHTRTPVYVVGIFSGTDKLGEGTGASLDEARIRAAISALKAWYLYSPLESRVPSDVEGTQQPWKPCLVDGGEVIV